jgi:hypothetical protein
MPVIANWEDDDKHIIRFIYEEPWTWHELFNAMKSVAAEHDELPHKVAWIMDLAQSRNIPTGALTQSKHIAGMRHDNTFTTTIVIHSGPFLAKLAGIFNTVFGERLHTKIKMVNTLDEALTEAQKLITEQV